LPSRAKRKSQKRADLATLSGPRDRDVTRAARAASEFLNTNGNAALASLPALGCIGPIERQGKRIGDLAEHYSQRLGDLADAYPERIETIHGKGLMAGIKFRDVEDALSFHRRCVDNGLWVRAHAYHEGHGTVLTKLGLCFGK